jgi:cytochrome c oxidase subunit 2
MLNKLMGIVPNASEHGYLIDHMLEFCHWFMLLLFVGWSIYFVYTLIRFHRTRNPRANYHGVKSKASAHLEFAVVIIEAVLLLGFALPLWAKRVTEDQFPDAREALRVRAVGEQFAWNFHYPGRDNAFGARRADLVTGNNPLGLDPNDPAGADDVVSKNDLHLVNHKPAVVEISSKDVIHSFAVHEMRVTQDAIPGSKVPMWFRPIKAGTYEIICAQLCGAGHFGMRATMTVESQQDWDAWQKDQWRLSHPGATVTPWDQPPAPAPATPKDKGVSPITGESVAK